MSFCVQAITVDARDDHRSAMNDRGYGCGTFHGVRKPDMHREHGRLAPSAGEYHHGTENERVGAADGAEPEIDGRGLECRKRERVDCGKVEAPDHIAHEDDAEKEETVGEAGENERLLRGAYRTGLVVPESDEQVA